MSVMFCVASGSGGAETAYVLGRARSLLILTVGLGTCRLAQLIIKEHCFVVQINLLRSMKDRQ